MHFRIRSLAIHHGRGSEEGVRLLDDVLGIIWKIKSKIYELNSEERERETETERVLAYNWEQSR